MTTDQNRERELVEAMKWLMEESKRIRVFPERDLRTNRLEMMVVDTVWMQRLRKLRQLGLAYLVYPTAEHSRFSHSLGTLYWTTKFCDSLQRNYFAKENIRSLEAMQTAMPNHISLLGVVRLYALLHDITHIPFGHTLEDQFGFFVRHDDDDERLDMCFEGMKRALLDSGDRFPSGAPAETIHVAIEHLLYARAIFDIDRVLSGHVLNADSSGARFFADEAARRAAPALVFVHDMVSNTLCADLVDYSLRDSMFTSMPRSFDKILLGYIYVFDKECKEIAGISQTGSSRAFRFGVNPVTKKLRHDVITGILSLLRTRYELAERVYYHHAKCSADAMLDKLMRAINWTQLKTTDLVLLGDDEFVALIARMVKESGVGAIVGLLEDFQSRRFYKEVFRISRSQPLSKAARAIVNGAARPEYRKEFEERLVGKMRAPIASDEVILSCRPEKMQMKQAGALVGWIDGESYSLADICEKFRYAPEVNELTRRYRELWTASVYISPRRMDLAPRIMEVLKSREFFDMECEDALRTYIRGNESIPWGVYGKVDFIRDGALEKVLDVAAGRGRSDDGVLEAYAEVVREERVGGSGGASKEKGVVGGGLPLRPRRNESE